MKLITWLQEATSFLTAQGIESARLESEMFAAQGLKLPLAELSLHFHDEIGKTEQSQLLDFLRRRGQREPIQYILGCQGFHEIHLSVGPGVLVPRPETEVLVEVALREVHPAQAIEVLDLCSGSGNIALSLARACSTMRVDAVEISSQALTYARENLRALQLQDRVNLLQGDLFCVPEVSGKKYDLIVSNPPYVCHNEMQGLQPEVRDFEPSLALDGGEDGLMVIRRIIDQAPGFLKTKGFLFMEIGFGQADQVLDLCEQSGSWQTFEVLADLRQVPRVLRARV